MNTVVIYTVGIIFGVARIFIGYSVPPESFSGIPLLVQCFKDLAHIYMGCLGTLAWLQGKPWQVRLFWGLVILECVVAFASRIQHA